MRRFRFHKLVRDKIVEGIESAGNRANWRILSEEEFVTELKKKVAEEAAEIPSTEGKELVKELADLQEVIGALLVSLSVPDEEFATVRKKKNDKAGAFEKKIFIEEVEAKDDSEWVEYYLKSPEKYPEIKK